VDRRLKPILAELRGRLEPLYGSRLARLVLFGSQAREDADPGSDVDVLVVLDGEVDPGEEIGRVGEAIAELSLRHDVVLSCTFVSLDRYLVEQSPLLINARREGVAA
jgi:uncharacterized protein